MLPPVDGGPQDRRKQWSECDRWHCVFPRRSPERRHVEAEKTSRHGREQLPKKRMRCTCKCDQLVCVREVNQYSGGTFVPSGDTNSVVHIWRRDVRDEVRELSFAAGSGSLHGIRWLYIKHNEKVVTYTIALGICRSSNFKKPVDRLSGVDASTIDFMATLCDE